VLIGVLCVGSLWTLFLRSGIPYELDGTVVDIQVGTEKLAGIDDVWIVHIDDRQLHLDYEFARSLGRRRVIEKPAWSPTVKVSGREDIHLAPSKEFWQMLVAVAAIALTLLGLGRVRAARSTSGSVPRPGDP
jgi:hypothetical protein